MLHTTDIKTVFPKATITRADKMFQLLKIIKYAIFLRNIMIKKQKNMIKMDFSRFGTKLLIYSCIYTVKPVKNGNIP